MGVQYTKKLDHICLLNILLIYLDIGVVFLITIWLIVSFSREFPKFQLKICTFYFHMEAYYVPIMSRLLETTMTTKTKLTQLYIDETTLQRRKEIRLWLKQYFQTFRNYLLFSFCSIILLLYLCMFFYFSKLICRVSCSANKGY